MAPGSQEPEERPSGSRGAACWRQRSTSGDKDARRNSNRKGKRWKARNEPYGVENINSQDYLTRPKTSFAVLSTTR